jgi:hypothetical protein
VAIRARSCSAQSVSRPGGRRGSGRSAWPRGVGCHCDCIPVPGPLPGRPARQANTRPAVAERITQMTDTSFTVASGKGARPPRCQELARTDRGWERCHRDEHGQRGLHHVRDRSWSTAGNMPLLRLGQPCEEACTWPDQVMVYRGGSGASGTGRRSALRRPTTRPAGPGQLPRRASFPRARGFARVAGCDGHTLISRAAASPVGWGGILRTAVPALAGCRGRSRHRLARR